MPREHMQINQKAKNSKEASRQLIRYIKPYLPLIIISLVLAGVGAILTVLGPDKLKEITDIISNAFTSLKETHIWTDIPLKDIAVVAISLLIIYIMSAICTFFTSFILARVALKISKKLRSDLERKINKVPLSYFSRNTYGDVLSRITNDVDTIIDALNNSISSVVSAICQFVFCVIMMFVTDAPMALTAILSTILGFALMIVIIKMSQKYFKARQVSLGALNGYIEEMYSGHDVVRVSNANKEVKEKFVTYNKAVRKANLMSQLLSGMMPTLMTFIGNIGYVAVCIVGAIRVINGDITFGVISAFLVYVRLFTQPLSSLSQGASSLQSCMAASERVFGFLNEVELEDESDKVTKIEHVEGNVTFDHVAFSYDDAPDKIVIKDFSCQVKKGQKVAIVGPTGAGKTTLVNLLMRFYEPISGSISIDGINIKDMKREDVHSLFSMVLQDTWLFEGTIKENLAFNTPNVSEEKIKEACKECGISEFIESLENGYETILNDNTSLSIGQKQLFTIARAMIQDLPMLILDEATSNVDTRTEIVIQKAMDQLTSNRTSFVIAHRLSTIKNADVILVLKDGDIIEQGSHQELLAKNGVYASLYNSQFDEGNDGAIDMAMKKLVKA